MSDPRAWNCHECGNVGLDDGFDGFFYCRRCGSRADDYAETGVADEDFADKGGTAGAPLYSASHRRNRPTAATAIAIKAEPISQLPRDTIQSQFWAALTLDDDGDGERCGGDRSNQATIKAEECELDGVGPTGPEDFGSVGKRVPSVEEYYNEIRMRYVMGLQLMIELQCEALVREFKVSPLICGLAGTVWLRFVAGTRVFDDSWVDDSLNEYESQHQEQHSIIGQAGESSRESDSQQQGDLPPKKKPRAKYGSEPHTEYGQRLVMIWFRSLRKKIPLSYSLGVSFLACHLAREAVLTTDIAKWSLEGKLPYFAAFVEIEERMGEPSSACPISTSLMFRPNESVTAQKLECFSASIADAVGLALPPVNFYAIASRYLQELSLPLEKILPHACRIYEWSMPPELWLSTNELRLPTRVCVMSILIVAIRILYNIHGFGEWEKSLSRHHTCSTSKGTEESKLKPALEAKEYTGKDSGSPQIVEDSGTKPDLDAKEYAGKDSGSPQIVEDSGTKLDRDTLHAQKTELDAAELLCNLQARYYGINENYEYSKDLPTYLQFCKDVVFAGSFEDFEEERLIKELWNIYQSERDSKTEVQEEAHGSEAVKQKRTRTDVECRSFPPKENKRFRDKGCVGDLSPSDSSQSAGDRHSQNSDQFDSSQDDQSSEQEDEQALADILKDEASEILKDEAIGLLKLDMEENRFYYIPPRVNPKRFDYLHYARKKDEGALTYVAHADYYLLLRACAKVANMEIRLMHIGVLSFERRLAWIEHRINHCLHLKPPTFFCEFCSALGNTT